MMNVTATALRPGRVRFQINPMPEYLYLIHPYRHGFFDDPTPEEQTVMDEHFNYLKRAADAGTVLLAGPCLDDTFGLVVFRAENDDAANMFMFNDPSVKANVMMAELHPFRASLTGH
jgi:uncharacterized protein YciI